MKFLTMAILVLSIFSILTLKRKVKQVTCKPLSAYTDNNMQLCVTHDITRLKPYIRQYDDQKVFDSLIRNMRIYFFNVEKKKVVLSIPGKRIQNIQFIEPQRLKILYGNNHSVEFNLAEHDKSENNSSTRRQVSHDAIRIIMLQYQILLVRNKLNQSDFKISEIFGEMRNKIFLPPIKKEDFTNHILFELVDYLKGDNFGSFVEKELPELHGIDDASEEDKKVIKLNIGVVLRDIEKIIYQIGDL
jgi:hypothetical protein